MPTFDENFTIDCALGVANTFLGVVMSVEAMGRVLSFSRVNFLTAVSNVATVCTPPPFRVRYVCTQSAKSIFAHHSVQV